SVDRTAADLTRFANRYLSFIEPVCGTSKRKLKNDERRLAPPMHQIQAQGSEKCQSETPRTCLTRRKRFSCGQKAHRTDWTAWLTMQSNSNPSPMPNFRNSREKYRENGKLGLRDDEVINKSSIRAGF